MNKLYDDQHIKQTFSENVFILNSLIKYAPNDDRLLNIPKKTNITDPWFKLIFQMEQNSNCNNFLLGLNLFEFLRSVNRSLSKVYAAHAFLRESRNSKNYSHLNQNDMNSQLYLDSIVIAEYNKEIRFFFVMLRIAVDQIIFLASQPHNLICLN